LKIPILTDDPGWHGAQLKQAFDRRDVEATFVSLLDCSVHMDESLSIRIPGFESEELYGVFVRGVSGGTLQQVITRLNILHLLHDQGVVVYNHGRAIERTVDKAMTSMLLNQQKVPTPKTWVCESRLQAEQIRGEVNAPLVLKPLFGSQGMGIRKLYPHEPLPVPMQQYVDGVYYLQQFIETPDFPHDYRLFVVHGHVVAGMKRIGHDWVNNVAAGGQCIAIRPNEVMVDIALKAAKAVNIDYCGVDIIEAKAGGYYVLEVNSIPAWKGLQSVTEVDISQYLVDDFLGKIASGLHSH
jgi:tetrahydromethanopterin:alpha-L-glutamate ligase